jgi:2-polyprenyl-6-hydroxyphenyl methylase / 3-demethylubiquinone-9 3-methyltransferase
MIEDSNNPAENIPDASVDPSVDLSVDPKEVANFAAMAESWWDPLGKFKPLHQINPLRLAYLKDTLCAHFSLASDAACPFDGLRVLDIGCGGGLLSEPVRRLGADVVGADAAARNIEVAKLHAGDMGLFIDYRHTTAEALAEAGERFDVILNMEVIEHVGDVASFVGACNTLLDEKGIMMLSTLNRTAKSYLFAIVGAEYILGWLPRGTHNWNKFLKPSELARALRDQGLELAGLKGMGYNPLNERWSLNNDLSVNYMGFAKPSATAKD